MTLIYPRGGSNDGNLHKRQSKFFQIAFMSCYVLFPVFIAKDAVDYCTK